jgi:hypothetical protein
VKKKGILIFLLLFLISTRTPVFAQVGAYLGVYGGFSAQKPSLTDVEFSTDTTFVYGARAGVRFMMFALEGNYFQAAHNLKLKELVALNWDGLELDYSYIGLNLNLVFTILALQPYFTFGYGYYTANIQSVGKDRKGGINFGAGLEVMLGRRLSLVAEGRYHQAKVSVSAKELSLGNLILCGGLNLHF